MDFHPVKAAGDGVARGVAVVLHDAGQLLCVQRARLGGLDKRGHAIFDQHGFGVGTDGRWPHRGDVVRLQFAVRYAAHVPQLHHDFAARLVNRLRDRFPAVQLFGAVQTGYVGIALCCGADGRAFGDDEARRGALLVVAHHHGGRNRVGGAVARQRCHHHAVGQLQCTGVNGVKKGGCLHSGDYRSNTHAACVTV